MAQIDRRSGVYQQAAIKLPCRVVATSNITLDGLQTIDGVTVVADDRVLVTGQTDTTENGIYAADTGEWQRTEDFDGSRDIVEGTIIAVNDGTQYSESVWRVTTSSPTIGSALAFARMGASALSVASAFMLTVLDDTTPAEARTTLGAVGLTGNEAVAGNKAFSGDNTHSGTETFSGTVTMTGKAINQAQGADIPSVAGTTDIGAATGNYAKVTGTNGITGLGTVQAGTRRAITFTGALLLTHNATSLILPGGANITTAAGDCADFVSEGSGNWRCLNYQRAAASGATTFLGADVPLNNTANFFNGPNTGSLPPGTYLIGGTATVADTANAQITLEIHDGSAGIANTTGLTIGSTTVTVTIAPVVVTHAAATTYTLRARDATTANGTLKTSADVGTANKGTFITAVRLP